MNHITSAFCLAYKAPSFVFNSIPDPIVFITIPFIQNVSAKRSLTGSGHYLQISTRMKWWTNYGQIFFAAVNFGKFLGPTSKVSAALLIAAIAAPPILEGISKLKARHLHCQNDSVKKILKTLRPTALAARKSLDLIAAFAQLFFAGRSIFKAPTVLHKVAAVFFTLFQCPGLTFAHIEPYDVSKKMY